LSCSCVIAIAYIIVFLNKINGDGDDALVNFTVDALYGSKFELIRTFKVVSDIISLLT